MRISGRNAVALGVVLAAAALVAIPMTVAHVIYVYQSQVNFNATAAPVVWEAGPNAGAVSLTVTNKSSVIVSMAIPVTNATEIYVYQPLELVVNNGPKNLYVDECSYSTPSSYSWAPTSVELIVYPTTGSPMSPTGTITITPSTSGGCTASGSVSLTSGSYYIDVEVLPSLPAPHVTPGTTVGTLTLYLSVTGGSPVSVPT